MFRKLLLFLTTALITHQLSFDSQIQTGIIQPTFDSLFIANGYLMYFVSLANPKNTTSNGYALAISNIHQSFSSAEYSLTISTSNITTTSMQIKIESSLSNSLQKLIISYVVIDSSVDYLFVYHYSISNTLHIAGSSFSPVIHNEVITLSYLIDSSTVIIPMITGFDIEGNSNENMDTRLFASRTSSSNLKITISNKLTVTEKIRFLSADILLYHVTKFHSLYPSQQFPINRYSRSSTSNSLIIYTDSSIITSIFFGFSQFCVINHNINNRPFKFGLSTLNNNISLNIQSAGQYIKTQSIIFQIGVCNQTSILLLTACIECSNVTYADQNASLCVNCSANCLSCSSLECLQCNEKYLSNGSICVIPDCSSIPNCQFCSLQDNINPITCFNCSQNYTFNNSDCILNCSIMPNCLNCSLINSTIACQICAPYYMPAQNYTCIVNCSEVDKCKSCSFSVMVECTDCLEGYYLVNSSFCQKICGPGKLNPYIECDDGGSINGDGCGSNCKIQPFFNCSGYPSVCKLISLQVTALYTVKQQGQNSLKVYFKTSPAYLKCYQSISLAPAFTFGSISALVVDVVYNPINQNFALKADYGQDISKKKIELNYNFSILGLIFSNLINSSIIEISSTTQNNLSLQNYPSSVYSLSLLVEILSIFIGAIAIIQFLAGYFGSKLECLESIAVVQLASILPMTINNLSPTLNSLWPLRLASGSFQGQSSNYVYQDLQVSPQFKSQLYSNIILSNYNLNILAIIIPLIIALGLKVATFTSFNSSKLLRNYKLVLGTYTYYGILFCSYSVLISLFLDIKYFNKSRSFNLALDLIYTLILVVYLFAAYKYPSAFGSFKKSFEIYNICQHFYLFSTLERVATSLIIVLLASFNFQDCFLILIFVLEAIFILYRKPYVLSKWSRPAINKIIAILIIATFALLKVMEEQSKLYIYSPLFILLLLLACQTISIYYSVLAIRERWNKPEFWKAEQKSFMEKQNEIMEQFQKNVMSTLPIDKFQSILNEEGQIQLTNKEWQWSNYSRLYSIRQLKKIYNKERISPEKIQFKQQQEAPIPIKDIDLQSDPI